ncbi:MAG: hypothetical protein N3B18_12225 [Desulfobacterota bacterium]|nr:hypothetical protein [Thermodesulfobacteriota bacterium]
MAEIKSSYEKALEKLDRLGIEQPRNLTAEQKEKIARIREEYDAKIAERKILLQGTEELPREIAFLERERERKIREVYDTADIQ